MLLYNIAKSFDFNVQHGPFFNGNIPLRDIPEKKDWKKLFDYNILSSIGISACPLTANARGIQLASALGYDIITCKTVRSRSVPAHPWPHVVAIENKCINTFDDLMIANSSRKAAISYANSMGNPSLDLDSSIEEIKKGVAFLRDGQLLIASVYATGDTYTSIIDDFIYLAEHMKDAGVHAIEANLSCPNIEGDLLCKDAQFIYKLGNAIVKRIAPVPLIIKLSIISDSNVLKEVLYAAARSGIRGIAGINALAMKVVTSSNVAYFGKDRPVAGISGDLVRPYALHFVHNVRTLIDQNKLDLTLLAGGGITRADHINTYFTKGADTVMMATGVLANPYIAYEYNKLQKVILEEKI